MKDKIKELIKKTLKETHDKPLENGTPSSWTYPYVRDLVPAILDLIAKENKKDRVLRKCCYSWNKFSAERDCTFVYCPECGRCYCD